MNILADVRKRHIKDLAGLSLIIVIVFRIILSIFSSDIKQGNILIWLKNNYKETFFSIGMCGIFLLGMILCILSWINALKLIINPKKSRIFKLYGNEESINFIIEETEKNKIFDNGRQIVSNKYVYDRKDIEQLAKCEYMTNVSIKKKRGSILTRYWFEVYSGISGDPKGLFIFKTCNEKEAIELAQAISSVTGLDIERDL